jgi:hypothetical protein
MTESVCIEKSIHVRRLNPKKTTAPTTINAPKICMKAMRWLSIAQPKIKANTGSMFMMALLPATPSLGKTVNMRVKPLP